jgi:hypothetical protein
MEALFFHWGHVIASFHGGFIAISTFTLGFGVYLFLQREAIDWNSGLKTVLVGTGAFLISGIAGLLLFPKFRLEEGMYFDPSAPWISALFDLREGLVAVGLLVTLVIILHYILFTIEEEAKPVKQAFLNLAFFLFVIAGSITGIIFLLMMLKLIGGAPLP